MRYNRGIRFDLFTDIDVALKKVVSAAHDIDESKGFIREAGRAIQAYNRAYPNDSKMKEAFKTLEEAHKKAESTRLLLIQAMAKIDK